MSVFDQIWDYNGWQNEESASGNGSTLEATIAIRRALPDLFKRYDIQRVIDAACGDFHWWPEIKFDVSPLYLGVDIVEGLIQSLQMEWSGSQYTFEVGDITKHPLSPAEPADLILARDVFVHLPNAKIKAALANIRKSNAKYLLATTFPKWHDTSDIQEGFWRPVNLEEYWGLSKPIELINEKCKIPSFEDKSLGLWRLK